MFIGQDHTNSTTLVSNEEAKISNIFSQRSTNAKNARQNETSSNLLTPTPIMDTILISDDDSDHGNISFTSN